MKPTQQDLFRGHHTFIIQLNSLALDRVLARIQKKCAHTLSVLFVLKMHADFESGLVKMGTALIAEICGCSTDSVSKAVGILEKEKLLKKVSSGRGKRPTYQLLDQVELHPIVENLGLKPKLMSFPFKPKQMTDRVKDIVAYKRTGELSARADAAGVLIENLVINVEVHNHYYENKKEITYQEVNARQQDLEDVSKIKNKKIKEMALRRIKQNIEELLADCDNVVDAEYK